jgi:hypothetical protein
MLKDADIPDGLLAGETTKGIFGAFEDGTSCAMDCTLTWNWKTRERGGQKRSPPGRVWPGSCLEWALDRWCRLYSSRARSAPHRRRTDASCARVGHALWRRDAVFPSCKHIYSEEPFRQES